MTCDCGAIKCGMTHYNWCSSLKPIETKKPESAPHTIAVDFAYNEKDYLDATRYMLSSAIKAENFQCGDEVEWANSPYLYKLQWFIVAINGTITSGYAPKTTYEIRGFDTHGTETATVTKDELSLVSRRPKKSPQTVAITLPKGAMKAGTVYSFYSGGRLIHQAEGKEE